MTTELVPRATIECILARRRQALDLYDKAHAALLAASAALDEARKAALSAGGGKVNGYNWSARDERASFIASLDVPARADFLGTARRLTDIDIWAHLVEMTELERLMDKKAKDQFRTELQNDPPEATADNIYATLQQLAADSGTIFRRGIAEAFSNLDRRFRSHDGWKIGSRVILTRTFDESGHWNYHRNERDTLQDIERTFYVLEGLTPPVNYGGIVGAVEAARRGGWGARQTELETEFFKLRIFKNGNAHLWFKRDDLLRKVNKLLAEYYGEVIPEEREPDADTGFDRIKTVPARHYGFFPTPGDLAADIVRNTPFFRKEGEPLLTVLEPSAGTGNLARHCVVMGGLVDCIELQAEHAEGLRNAGHYRRVWQADFLSMRPDPDTLYDRVVMNPPFDRERDIDHVLHALRFLKPDGYLVAIMSAGTEFRETKKATAFRGLIQRMRGKFRDLPARSFAPSGTNVNTIVLRVWMDGRRINH